MDFRTDAAWPSCFPRGYTDGEGIHSFRFPEVRAGNIRACDDLRYGCFNPRYGGGGPIALLTCGDIGEMCLQIAAVDRGGPLPKLIVRLPIKTFPSRRIPLN